MLWGSLGETVLWGPFGAKGFVSVAHVTPALSVSRTGRASTYWGHICPQGRVFTGLVLRGRCSALGRSRQHCRECQALRGSC